MNVRNEGLRKRVKELETIADRLSKEPLPDDFRM